MQRDPPLPRLPSPLQSLLRGVRACCRRLRQAHLLPRAGGWQQWAPTVLAGSLQASRRAWTCGAQAGADVTRALSQDARSKHAHQVRACVSSSKCDDTASRRSRHTRQGARCRQCWDPSGPPGASCFEAFQQTLDSRIALPSSCTLLKDLAQCLSSCVCPLRQPKSRLSQMCWLQGWETSSRGLGLANKGF